MVPRAKCWARAEVGFPVLLLLFTVNDEKAQVGDGSVYFSSGDGILATEGQGSAIISTLLWPKNTESQTN